MSKLTHEERMAEARNLMGSAQQTRPQGARSSTQGASCSATQVASRPVARGDGRPGTQEAACGNLPRGGAPTENPSAHRSASHGTMEKSSTGRGKATAAGTSLLKQKIAEIAARSLEFLNAKTATRAAATSPTATKADLEALAAATAHPGAKNDAAQAHVAGTKNTAKRAMPGLNPRAAVFTPGAGAPVTETEEDAGLPPPVVEYHQSAKSTAGAGAVAGVSRGRVERGRDACACSGLKKAKGLASSRFAGPVAAPVAGRSRFTGVCPVHDAWEGI